MDRRTTVVTLLFLAAAIALSLGALCVGRYYIPPLSLLDGSAPAMAYDVIFKIRLPRVLLALVAGAGLGVAGAAFQALFSNPLATPDTLGVATGASFGAVLGILLGMPSFAVQISALLFGVLSVVIVLAVSKVRGTPSVIMMILAGMVVSALFSALVSLLKYVADPQDVLPAITFWLMGSLSGTTLRTLFLGTPFILSGIAVLYALRWKLNVMTLSEDEAASLGVPVKFIRLAVISAAALITGSVVSMCGLIGWVGLLIPHAARMAYGSDNRAVIPASMMLGALFMLIIDTTARTALASEIPTSILTAVIGAPFFIFLLRRTGGVRP